MKNLKTRSISLYLTFVMIVSSLCFLAVSSYGNDLNEPVEYRDEAGKIIGAGLPERRRRLCSGVTRHTYHDFQGNK